VAALPESIHFLVIARISSELAGWGICGWSNHAARQLKSNLLEQAGFFVMFLRSQRARSVQAAA
jgi:hypothetical protein